MTKTNLVNERIHKFNRLEDMIKVKDEQIERLNNMLIDALQKLNEAQKQAHVSSSWSMPPGNV